MMDREEINKEFTMVSPLDIILNQIFYVNIYGDTVISGQRMGAGPLILSEEEAQQIVTDVSILKIRIDMGEQLTYTEKLMFEIMTKTWY